MKRRTYLRAAGVTAAVGLAGCLGDGEAEMEAANEFGYDTEITDGVAVPLVPTADAIEWHENDEAVFADARSRDQYEELRIADAVFSPAPQGLEADDPLDELPTDTRLVTYCVCPHTLATNRGASLVRDGYAHVYALDEGLAGWVEAGHPLEGTGADAAQSVEFDHSYEDQLD